MLCEIICIIISTVHCAIIFIIIIFLNIKMENVDHCFSCKFADICRGAGAGFAC